MIKILNWFKSLSQSGQTYIKPQKFVDLKRTNSTVEFIRRGHPLYDSIVETENNQIHLYAPNESAYNETSLTHNFVAVVTRTEEKYLVINSLKHFKEQSIGGLLQFDENIYNVIPFSENDEEYQTADNCIFSETYEYDHPVETYAFTAEQNGQISRITLERGKQPITIRMIDEKRPLFTEKLTTEQISLIDYAVIPTLNAYTAIQERHKNKAS